MDLPPSPKDNGDHIRVLFYFYYTTIICISIIPLIISGIIEIQANTHISIIPL